MHLIFATGSCNYFLNFIYWYFSKKIQFCYFFITQFSSVTNFSTPYMSSATAIVYLAFPLTVSRLIRNNVDKFQEMFSRFCRFVTDCWQTAKNQQMNGSQFRTCMGGHTVVTRKRDNGSNICVFSDVKFGDGEGHGCFYFPLQSKMSVSASVPGFSAVSTCCEV